MEMFNSGILASGSPLDHVVQHELFRFSIVGHEFSFSNHMLMVLAAGGLMLLVFPVIARQGGLAPRGLRNFFESICVFLREEVARPVLGENTDRFVPFLWTTFFFILFCNLLGMIPLDGIVQAVSGGSLRHYGGTATANIWVTGTLAATVFVMIHVSGMRQQGPRNYIKNLIPHVPWPLIPAMYFLEFIGALVKPFALAIRLFANMLAGHTVLGALLGLAIAARSYSIGGVTVVGCAVLSILELFVAFLQAYIFTYLTTMFIGAAVQPEH